MFIIALLVTKYILPTVSSVSYMATIPVTCYVGARCTASLNLFMPRATTSEWNLSFHYSRGHSTDPITFASTLVPADQSSVILFMVIPVGTTPGSGYLISSRLKGGDFEFYNSTDVRIALQPTISFIQTDKLVYQPTEIVTFEVFCIRSETQLLLPCDVSCKMNVTVVDPDGCKVKEWINMQPVTGVTRGEMELAGTITTGDWKVRVSTCGYVLEEAIIFKVEELARTFFKVAIEAPRYYVYGNTGFPVTVIATYEKDSKVVGSLKVEISCSVRSYQENGPMATVYSSKEFVGILEYTIEDDFVAHCMNGFKTGDVGVMVIIATVSEYLTGNREKETAFVGLHQHEVQLKFLKRSPPFYVRGTTYVGALQVEFLNRSLAENEWGDLKFTLKGRSRDISEAPRIRTFFTDDAKEGSTINFAFDTTDLQGLVIILAELKSTTKRFSVEQFTSETRQTIQVSAVVEHFACGETARFVVEVLHKVVTMPFYYLFVCRGQVVESSSAILSEDTYVVVRQMTPKYSPECSFVAYFVISDELAASMLEFTVDCSQTNPVYVKFVADDGATKNVLYSKEEMLACVSAKPGSYVTVLATESQTYQSVLTYESLAIFIKSVSSTSLGDDPLVSNGDLCRMWLTDSRSIFFNSGLRILTDGYVVMTQPNRKTPSKFCSQSATSRWSVSPLHWLWIFGPTNDNGIVCKIVKAPGECTRLTLSIFTLSSTSGFGLIAEKNEINVRKALLILMHYPEALKKGEEFLLIISVSNLEKSEKRAEISLWQSNDFLVRYDEMGTSGQKIRWKSKPITIPSLIKVGETATVKVWIYPQVLGNITLTATALSSSASHAVTGKIMVEPEGVLETFVSIILIDLRQNLSTSDQFVPLGALTNSGKMSSFVSDVVVAVANSLETVLAFNRVFGERNAISLFSDTLLLKYLDESSTTSPDLRKTILRKMTLTYQQQLAVRHPDGSFGALLKETGGGNLWLTSLTAKVLHQARSFIFVDEDVLIKATKWILMHQNSDGFFHEPGNVSYPEIQIITQSDRVAISAHVLIALVENLDIGSDGIAEAIKLCTDYLYHQIDDLNDVHAISLATYALHVANSTVMDLAHDILTAMAIIEGNKMYWSTGDINAPVSAKEIETTAYGLLVSVIRQDHKEAVRIWNWLSIQMKAEGSMLPTHAVAVILQALSQSSTMLIDRSINMDIKLRCRNHNTVIGDYQFVFTDSMKTYFFKLPLETNNIEIAGLGYGTAALSIVSKNYKAEDKQTFFRMTVHVENHSEYQYSLQICQWSAAVPITGMSVTEIYGLSGFKPDRSSIELKPVDDIKHVDVASNRATVYHDNIIESKPTCMSILFKRSAIVRGHQRAVVKAFNSQRPGQHAVVFYFPAVRRPRMVEDHPRITQDDIAVTEQTSKLPVVPHVFLVPNVCYTNSECVIALHLLKTIDSDSVCNVSLYSLQDTKFLYPLSTASSVMTKMHTVATFNLFIPGDKPQAEGTVKFTLENSAIRFRLSNSSLIKIRRNRSMLLIKTDKELYKQSEIVKYRVMCIRLDSETLEPCSSSCKLNVSLIEPNGYTMKQLANRIFTVGVFFGEFHLADIPVTGKWMIKTSVCDSSYGKEFFSVLNYVEPVFHIKLSVPSHHFIGSSSLLVAVSALRDFAKHVEGEISIIVSFESEQLRFLSPIVNTSDTFKFNYELSILDKDIVTWAGGKRILDNTRLVFKVKVREIGTDFTELTESVVTLYTREVRFRFTDSSPTAYMPNTTYDGSLHIEMAHESLVNKEWNGLQITIRSETSSFFRTIAYFSFQNVDANGIIKFSFDTKHLKGLLAIEARLDDMKELKYIDEFRSLNKEFIHVSLKSNDLKCGESAEFDVTLSSKLDKVFSYVFVCRGIMVENSQDFLKDGKYVIWRNMTSIHSPSCKLLVFTEFQQEIIADSIHFVVECFSNAVKIHFPESRHSMRLPSVVLRSNLVNIQIANKEDRETVSLENHDQQVTVCATAKPHSFVGLAVGDQLAPNAVADISSVNIDYQFQLQHKTDERPPLLLGIESLEMFQLAGVRVLSNLAVYKLSEINKMEILAEWPITRNDEALMEREKVRNERLFSETWLWLHGRTDESGRFCHSADVPDRSATWRAFGFAMSESGGLGVVLQPTKIALRRTHDVFMKCPLSVKRHEQFLLTISVMNYIDSVQTINIILQKSRDFSVKNDEATDVSDMGISKEFIATSNVEPKSANFVDVWIIPKVFGNITLSVEARSAISLRRLKQVVVVVSAGLLKHSMTSVLVDLRTGNPVSKTLKDIELPTEASTQSGLTSVYLSGDLLALTLQHLEKLTPQLTEYGEQNLITFVSSTLVLRYLSVFPEILSSIQDKIRGNLEMDYQRRMVFFRKDNSFSLFGNADKSGSLWLTAFVTKSFLWASDFIFVDQHLLSNSLVWILRQQEADGAFREPGRTLHPSMQGIHTESKMSLTAFVVIALQEYKNATVDLTNAIVRASSYLGRHFREVYDVYTTAIVTYALHLVNNELKDAAFAKLDSVAKVQDGEKYWTKVAGDVYEMPSAVDIETTAYALLTTILRDGPDAFDIAKWLIHHSNGRGGFFSTPDTAVVLNALSELASSVKSITSNLVVSVRFYEQDNLVGSHRFVSKDKRFEVQKIKAPMETDVVKVTATGSGFAVVSIVGSYHQLIESYSSIHLSVDVKDQSQYAYTLHICHWSTDILKTGVGVVLVEAITGFSLRPQDADIPLQRYNVMEIDVGRSQVALYYVDIAMGFQSCFSVSFRRKRIVASLQNACVKVFSYHDPRKQAHKCYRFSGNQPVSLTTAAVKRSAALSVSSTTTSIKPITKKRESEHLQSGVTRLHSILMVTLFEFLLLSFELFT